MFRLGDMSQPPSQTPPTPPPLAPAPFAADGDIRRAREALEREAQATASADTWLKLAALRRAMGEPRRALDAVHKALEIDPLNFLGLFSRASLLETLQVDGFGEAYARALAHQPKGALPPAIAKLIDHAQRCADAYGDDREKQLLQAVAVPLSAADTAVAQRIRRFCSNTVRKTRPYHSEPTHYAYPGLTEREFHDRADFPWLEELESTTPTILAECQAILAAREARREAYVQYPAHEPLAQWKALNHNMDWTAIHLWRNGSPVEDNARLCPQTTALLARLPQPDIAGCSPNAMLSLLAPHTQIPPHVGVTNTRLVCHLPLIVPQGCTFRVGAETRHWQAGQAFVFDDSIEHEARNDSDQLRVVLIFDVWHPGLSSTEQDAVRQLLGADASSAALAL